MSVNKKCACHESDVIMQIDRNAPSYCKQHFYINLI